MTLMLSRRSALAGAAASLLAACTTPDGTKKSARDLLESAVRIARRLVSAGKVAATLYRTNCANRPDSKLCTNATIQLAVTTGEGALRIAEAALSAAEAALNDAGSTEERIGEALGHLLSAQDDIEAMIDRLGEQKAELPPELGWFVERARSEIRSLGGVRQEARLRAVRFGGA